MNYFINSLEIIQSEETIKEITTFVENECSLEDGETEEMLINDLVNQVYNK